MSVLRRLLHLLHRGEEEEEAKCLSRDGYFIYFIVVRRRRRPSVSVLRRHVVLSRQVRALSGRRGVRRERAVEGARTHLAMTWRMRSGPLRMRHVISRNKDSPHHHHRPSVRTTRGLLWKKVPRASSRTRDDENRRERESVCEDARRFYEDRSRPMQQPMRQPSEPSHGSLW